MISTAEPTVGNPVDEVRNIVALAVEATVAAAALQRANTCGCRGCKAQAIEAFEWAQRSIDDPDLSFVVGAPGQQTTRPASSRTSH